MLTKNKQNVRGSSEVECRPERGGQKRRFYPRKVDTQLDAGGTAMERCRTAVDVGDHTLSSFVRQCGGPGVWYHIAYGDGSNTAVTAKHADRVMWELYELFRRAAESAANAHYYDAQSGEVRRGLPWGINPQHVQQQQGGGGGRMGYRRYRGK